jgi:hypothetical protein
MSNTGLKYISQTDKGFVFTVPSSLRHAGQPVTVSSQVLGEVVTARNACLGNNPDQYGGEPGKLIVMERAPLIVGDEFSFLALGDTHLCNKYARLDALHAIYKYAAAQGITTALHTGNWIEGEARFNKAQVLITGAQNQVEYFVENYPAEGIDTYIVDGDDHCGWYLQAFGMDPGLTMQMTARAQGRNDLHSLGYMIADFPVLIGETLFTIQVAHPGGGSAIGVSLKSQRWTEEWDGDKRADLVLLGHYHKADFLPAFNRVPVIQTGALVESTPFLKKKNIRQHLGAWLVTLRTGWSGHITVAAEWLPVEPRKWRAIRRMELI